MEADQEEEEEWVQVLARVQEEEQEAEVVLHSSPPAPRLPASSPPPCPRTGDAVLIFGGQESDDEDEVKDYIGELEADSAASESPASQGREERRSRSRSSLSDHEEELGAGLGKVRVTEQDTISDESGYSEDPSLGKEVTVVKVNLSGETPAGEVEFLGLQEQEEEGRHKLEIRLQGGQEQEQVTITGRGGARWSQPLSVETSGPYSREVSPELSSPSSEPCSTPSEPCTPPSESPSSPRSLSASPRSRSPSPISHLPPSPRNVVSTSPRVSDLSVKSVLLSEFSSTDKNRYIERSGPKPSKSAMVLNRQEFCINI